MKRISIFTWCLVAMGCLGIATSSLAADGGVIFKFPVGLSYANGAFDVNDKLKDSFNEGGYNVDDNFVWPVGLTFNPRVEFPFGLGVGLAFGPTQFIAVEKDIYSGYGYSEDTEVSYIIPVGGYLQYNFLRDRTVSPYVRAGVRFPITGGDNISDGTVGVFGAGGVEFFRNQKVAFGIEIGYDTSEVEVNANVGGSNKTATPIGFNVSIFALF